MIWLDGRLLDPSKARIDPADRGLLLGDGVFETVRVTDGRPAHLARHLARLREGAAVLGIGVPRNEPDMQRAVSEVLRAAGQTHAALRITLTRGPARRGLLPAGDTRPTLLITASPLPVSVSPARRDHRVGHTAQRALAALAHQVAQLSRRHPGQSGSGCLAGRRGDPAQHARPRGGGVRRTIFSLWWTAPCSPPPIDDGALPGIARAMLLESGLAAERAITAEDVRGAKAAFVTSSLGLRVLSHMDGVALHLASRHIDAGRAEGDRLEHVRFKMDQTCSNPLLGRACMSGQMITSGPITP